MIVLPEFSNRSADFTYSIELESGLTQLRMAWNVRAEHWFLTVSDSVGSTLHGLKCVPSYPLTRFRKGVLALSGDFMLLPTHTAVAPYPGYDLSGWRLCYLNAQELELWREANGLE